MPHNSIPEQTINYSIQPKTRGDEDKISTALSRIEEEDPTVHHQFDPETKQLLISGVGSMHVEMTVERMKRKYNVDVTLLPPRIPYKETVKGRAEGQGKYKKQTGGRGQYGDTWLRVEPMARGGGFEFVDDIFGGAVPRNFIPSVEKVVRAQAPMAEMLTYEPSLRSMTGGRGGYSMEFSHYEEVPAFLAEKVIKEVKTEKEKQTH